MTKKTIYFGYGSNLWRSQMASRCPSSPYLGLARLNNYRWIINSRGYANVIEIPADERRDPRREFVDEVWGLVYALPAEDEERLDGNEGVPECYEKEVLRVDFWATNEGTGGRSKEKEVDEKKEAEGFSREQSMLMMNVRPLLREPEETVMLVYIDRKRILPDEPKKEYVFRMNMGIRDALIEGVPEEYVKLVMRPFIPDEDEGDAEVEAFARKQALSFEDEN